MQTKIIEATNGFNWGKFLLGRLDYEWNAVSEVSPRTLLMRSLGWSAQQPWLWVLDLQTGEGAFFCMGGNASADLNKHKIWVCPLFEPFLNWLYRQDAESLLSLPNVVQLPEADSAFYGYRREGTVKNKIDEAEVKSSHTGSTPSLQRLQEECDRLRVQLQHAEADAEQYAHYANERIRELESELARVKDEAH